MSISVAVVVKGALQGKTIARILFNDAVCRNTARLSGLALDLASGAKPSYLSLLPSSLKIVRTNRIGGEDVSAVDINGRLPFDDKSFDAVFLFNALYVADDALALAIEVKRVLRPGGAWLVLSPFIANEMREPHDFLRLTAEGLERLGREAGFSKIEIERLGERASAAAHLMHPFFLNRFLRVIAFTFAVLLDRLIPSRVLHSHPTPLSYWVSMTK
jgi:SAM-dependent methyltransferase